MELDEKTLTILREYHYLRVLMIGPRSPEDKQELAARYRRAEDKLIRQRNTVVHKQPIKEGEG